jgi:hypothetical protein
VTPRKGPPLGRSARIPGARRLGVYAVGAGIWLTGGLWLLFHHFLRREGPLGLLATHPLEAWSLRLHGLFAFAAVWIFGLLWGVHVAQGWSIRRRRSSGGVLVGVAVLLVVTGYLLYYLGDERLRAATSLVHWIVGLGCPLAFAVHRIQWLALRKSRSNIRVA